MDSISNVLGNLTIPESVQSSPCARTKWGNCEPDCPICGGSGWIRTDAPLGSPQFGKLQPCPNVDPKFLYGLYSGLESDDWRLNWNTVVDYSNSKIMVAQAQKALERGGWLYVYGSYGQAKTLVLKIATAVSIVQHKKQAAYTRMAEIINDLRSAFDADKPSEEGKKRIDFWSSVPVLCIDEFEKVRGTEYANEQRFVLMDRRYESGVKRQTTTIMASNIPPENLDGYLADRIFDGRFTILKLTGTTSMRKNMQ